MGVHWDVHGMEPQNPQALNVGHLEQRLGQLEEGEGGEQAVGAGLVLRADALDLGSRSVPSRSVQHMSNTASHTMS